ncbi:hydroxyproline dehydrogenase isoform X2 [Protopterus annectens]|uniref:hydroxyproline dehydrogenase isoform X2 n=1 Tax=Protopterus annectens TaxID=7888 RepID=UPI001CFA0AAF|nr:hydroxyproline dehydrogenase isoform X2 [Protopterus annectens]
MTWSPILWHMNVTPLQRNGTEQTGQNLCHPKIYMGMKGADCVAYDNFKLMQLTRKALGQKLFSAVMKASAYGQFVAGETLPEIQQSMEKLKRMGIRPMLAVPIEEDIGEDKEGEKWYDRNLDTMIRCVDISITGGKRSMMQLKVTALMSAELCKTITHHLKDPVTRKSLSFESLVRAMDGQTLHLSCLTKEENHHFLASLQRFNKIGQYAKDNKVHVLVDAEYTYINPALTLVTLAMMMKFNQSVPWIWNTYQCYLKEAYNLINEDIELSSRLGFCFGAKLVRGAYMDKERKLAKEKGYPDPINENWEATNRSYQRVLDRMLDLVGENSERYNIIVASHNEASVKQAIRRIETMKISKEGGAVCFGQLLGMCDHVSMTLGQKGYAIYKSIPYGPIDDVMPYLVRRAQENQSVLLGIRKERDLLQKELKRRIFFRGRKNAENNVDYTLPTDKR